MGIIGSRYVVLITIFSDIHTILPFTGQIQNGASLPLVVRFFLCQANLCSVGAVHGHSFTFFQNNALDGVNRVFILGRLRLSECIFYLTLTGQNSIT